MAILFQQRCGPGRKRPAVRPRFHPLWRATVAIGLVSLGARASSLEFTGFESATGPLGPVFFLTHVNQFGQVTRHAYLESPDRESRFFRAYQYSNVSNKSDLVSSDSPATGTWVDVDYDDLGPDMMHVHFSSADKSYWLANTQSFTQGFGDHQAGGPEYPFLMSKYEVRNQEYVAFLNDAQSHVTHARGFNFFVGTNGSVWFKSSEVNGGNAHRLFSIASGEIAYNATNPLGARYSVPLNYVDFPVSGVTWYGALKFCNWLTIVHGLGESQRCYREGPEPADWRPFPATNWPVFRDAERQSWITNYFGYRLPMHHASNTQSSAFNEFFKAAGWNGLFSNPYGFGRTFLVGGDANYFGSGDPFDNGKAYAGLYDGTPVLSYGTRPNFNRYGIFDLTGNVSEWLTDAPTTSSTRSIRGGNFLSPASDLMVTQAQAAAASAALNFLGFRVVCPPDLRIGTNLNEVAPLAIDPAGAVIGFLDSVVFVAVGGTGTNTWTVAQGALGTLSTNAGPSATYTSTSTTGLQAVVVYDGLTASTALVEQLNLP